MNILSYRGPGVAGGVSGSLAHIADRCAESSGSWWYMSGNSLTKRVNSRCGSDEPQTSSVADLNADLIEGHYRYCNELLWPVMHDLPQFARLNPDDRQSYRRFNLEFARKLQRSAPYALDPDCMINDYQLALLPRLLDARAGARRVVFWHIPWPRFVLSEHVEPLIELASGLLSAHCVGFHTREYALNFLDFVERHMPGHAVDYGGLQIGRPFEDGSLHTKLLVAPLGLDLELWSGLAGNLPDERQGALPLPESQALGASIRNGAVKMVLSADRADYTKGVLQRLEAIDAFLERFPEWRGRAVFVQLCQRTRPGLAAFDAYWDRCRERARRLSARWRNGDWKPVVWPDTACGPQDLARLYRTASLMLVNPVRDGLNLTAKEFVACTGENPGALVLSRGAGVWSELGGQAFEVDPQSLDSLVVGIHAALTASRTEKTARASRMLEKLKSNRLEDWWEALVQKSPSLRPLKAPRVSADLLVAPSKPLLHLGRQGRAL